jgi:hypothetical protein
MTTQDQKAREAAAAEKARQAAAKWERIDSAAAAAIKEDTYRREMDQ